MNPDRPGILDYRRGRFAAQLPLDCLYHPSHSWIARFEGQTWRVGLTRFGTRSLGETVDLGFSVEVDAAVVPGQVVGWVEGFKAIVDLVCLAEGRFGGGNPALAHDPALLHSDPHGAGWLYTVAGTPAPTCLEAEDYAKVLDQAIDRIVERRRQEEQG